MEPKHTSPASNRQRSTHKYAVYPDYWKKSWGERPLLGIVFADDEFYAQREAYTRKLLTVNFTFGPKVVKLSPRLKRE